MRTGEVTTTVSRRVGVARASARRVCFAPSDACKALLVRRTAEEFMVQQRCHAWPETSIINKTEVGLLSF